jgi:hypothetical protein
MNDENHLRPAVLAAALSLLFTPVCIRAVDTAALSLPLEHALARIEAAGHPIAWTIDPALGHAEAFRLERSGTSLRVVAGGDAGVLYGVEEALAEHSVVGADGAPDFGLRGAVLMILSASWAYQSDLSPEVYPWFFDKPFMLRYLDHLLSARINTLILWSGHLFPHILELPEYPDASQFSADEIRRNQEQFRWLTTECARRNITVLTHFYNIHISEHQARALGRTASGEHDASRYTVPDDFVRGYYRTILGRYFETFPNVGLYICPGESLDLEHQQPWFRDVVFRAAEESGRNPKLIVRDWTLADDFKAALPSMYGNLYSELKHNDETLTSPWPDERHGTWKGVLGGHIVNLHDPADVVPYRVGSPRLLGEMVARWKQEGWFAGAWWYPPQCWIWPGTLDLEPGGEGEARDAGLNTLDRDELWHLLEGRLLWRSGRDPEEDRAWAAGWVGRKFGDARAGELLVDWYDLTGPILPGLQNLTAVRFGNFFPTSIAWVQATVDDILSYRVRVDDPPLRGPTGLTRQRYYSRPVDVFTVAHVLGRDVPAEALERNSPEHVARTFGLHDLRSLPVAQYAEMLVSGADLAGWLTPEAMLDGYAAMARRAEEIAREAAARPTNDPAEMRRFVNDSVCLRLTVEYYRHKVLAALHKRLLELTDEERHAAAMRAHVEASVPAYRLMMETAGRHYSKGTSMWDAKPWQRCLDEKVKPDAELQLRWLDERAAAQTGRR